MNDPAALSKVNGAHLPVKFVEPAASAALPGAHFGVTHAAGTQG
jgi:hypothetical protein